KSIVRKKNKRHLAITDTELQELIRQGLVVDEVYELENQCDNPREKVYHALMRELFGMKAFCKSFIQASLISKAQYFGNKIDQHIANFIIQIGEGKKGWLNHESVITLC
ncbi:8952_t:CDS:2, partial [Funneliformis caledonium]